MWKLTKVFLVSLERNPGGIIPYRLSFKDRDSYVASKTKQYDKEAMKYLSIVLFPLLVAYAIYGEHPSRPSSRCLCHIRSASFSPSRHCPCCVWAAPSLSALPSPSATVFAPLDGTQRTASSTDHPTKAHSFQTMRH